MPNIFHNSLSLGYGGGAPTPSYPTDGLIARWTFDETLEDDYGSNDLTYLNLGAASPTYVDGKIGKCIYFAQNGGVYTDNLHDYLKSYGTFSISYWVNAISPYGSWANISWMASRTSDTGYEMRHQNGDSLIWTSRGTTSLGSQSMSPNAWHHVVFTYNSSKVLTNYVDTSASSATINVDMGTTTIRMGFGYRVESTGNSKFKGYIDMAYFYNKALSASEVSQLYNGGSGI